MAKETTKKATTVASACEQYVVEKLKETEQKLNDIEKDYQALLSESKHLVKLIQTIAKNVEIDTESNEVFDHIYIRGSYVDNVWKERHKNNSDLIEFYLALEEIKRC